MTLDEGGKGARPEKTLGPEDTEPGHGPEDTEPGQETEERESVPKIVVELKKPLLAQRGDKLYVVTIDPLSGEAEPDPHLVQVDHSEAESSANG